MNSNSIRLLSRRRREILRRRPLGASPVTLSHKERTPHNTSIRFPRLFINDVLLVLNNGTSLALVVDTHDFVAELEFAAGGGGREGLQGGHASLAVEDAAGIEFGDAGDGDGTLGGVEINYFLGCMLEGCGVLEDGGLRWGRECLRRIMGYVGKTAKSGCNSYSD